MLGALEPRKVYKFVEFFSGHGNISFILKLMGKPGVAIDQIYSPTMSINENAGMAQLGAVYQFVIWACV